MQNNPLIKLHQDLKPLILPNIWDAASAVIVEKNGACALATSSASLAWSNGYADGGQLPNSVLINAIKNILRVISLPLSVDLENGYSDSPDQVAELVAELVELGVAGINIEDGNQSAELLALKIQAIKNRTGQHRLFINARTDVYLQQLVPEELRLDETLARSKKYLASGADGIFIPGLIAVDEISLLSKNIKIPLNVMVSPEQPNIDQLIQAGVKRISFGPSTFMTAYCSLQDHSGNLFKTNPDIMTYESLNQLFDSTKNSNSLAT